MGTGVEALRFDGVTMSVVEESLCAGVLILGVLVSVDVLEPSRPFVERGTRSKAGRG